MVGRFCNHYGETEMILLDPRVGSKELGVHLDMIGVPYKLESLRYGDACLSGNGPNGSIMIGIERKTLGDLLACINDGRYGGHQLPGMKSLYDRNYLIVEGFFKPRDNGMLMQLFRSVSWGDVKLGSAKVMYSKVCRFLLSVEWAGVYIKHSANLEHTAYYVGEIFHYHQKKWEDHTSLRTIHQPVIEDMNIEKPSLVRKWASNLEGIGVKHSLEAEKLFKTPMKLARASENDWMALKGIGSTIASNIVKDIWGISR